MPPGEPSAETTAPERAPAPDGPSPAAIYRSRQAALRERIASVEADLRVLRAELSGLPEVRARRFQVMVAALTLAALAAVVAVLWMRRPDAFTFTPMIHNAGWTLTFQFDRPIRCLDVIVEARDGRRDRVDCSTMPSAPQVAQAALTLDQAATSTLTVEYERGGPGGARRRVQTPFDPVTAQIAQVRQTLTIVGQWVEASSRNGRRLLYFSTLLTYGAVIREIRYGFDDGPLDKTVRFAPRTRLGVLDGDELYREIPASIHSTTVQVTFVDGTTMTRTVPTAPSGDER
jgi:hypothetical protein